MADISKIVIPSGDEFNLKASSITDSLKATLVDLMYPIGSIYMSVSSTNPGTTFGVGTWESWGSGRVPVGVDSNDTSFDTVEETGGNKSNSYTPAGTIGGTKLTAAQSGVPAHSHGLNSHTHTVGAHKHGLNSHTHTVGAHKHGLNSHTHTIPALSGTAAKKTLTGGLSMSESVVVNTSTANVIDAGSGIITVESVGSRKQSWANATVTGYYAHKWSATVDASHNHSVTTVANTTGEASGSTANSSVFNTGEASGSTENNTAKAASETHTHTWTGTAHNISTVQPYITCYMWKRTA